MIISATHHDSGFKTSSFSSFRMKVNAASPKRSFENVLQKVREAFFEAGALNHLTSGDDVSNGNGPYA